MEKKLLERFLKKNCIRQIKQLRNEKLIKRKSENYMSSGKVVITRLIDRQIKRYYIKMSYYSNQIVMLNTKKLS